MIDLNIRVRRAVTEDHPQITSLLLGEFSVHRHLDWRSPLDWLGSPNYWVLENDGHVLAALACPEDPPNVAWIRFFGHNPLLSEAEAWSPLWDMVRAEALRDEKTVIAAIITKFRFQNLLLAEGFQLRQNIVLLNLKYENIRTFSLNRKIRIRTLTEADMQAVTEIDLSAFGMFWHNAYESLMRAYRQSAYATVAEDESGAVVGYQLSTSNPLGVHLARLGVRKEAQGRGIGLALVQDLIQKANAIQRVQVTVNTQGDNIASLSLYRKIGFLPTGEYYPVLAYPQVNP